MVADVVLVGPGGLGEAAPRPARPEDTAAAEGAAPARARGRGVTATTLLVLGVLFTGLSVLVVVSSWRDDTAIDGHLGTAVADVLSVSANRTAVRFVTPDGTVVIPSNGVLYPAGLAAGERVRVQYDTRTPELVRVAGRDYTLALLPVGTSLLGAWAVLGPLVWFLRRGTAAKRRFSSRRRATS